MELKALTNRTPLQVVWELVLQERCRELFYTINIPTLNNLLIYHSSIYIFKNLKSLPLVQHAYSTHKTSAIASVKFILYLVKN